MNPPAAVARKPGAPMDFVHGASGQTWAVVLAGGEGVRLRPLARQFFGDDRPKQYLPLVGPASLFRQTLDRVGLLIPPGRTVVVSQAHHAGFLARDLAEIPTPPHVIFQPADRGTGTAVLYAAHWIHQRDPQATVVVFPADHFIREETAFMAHTAEIAAFVRRHPERLVLIGARALEPDPEYGWIKPGDRVGESAEGPIHRVQAFWEKPGLEQARSCLAADWLLNTFIFAINLSVLLQLGRTFVPTVQERLARVWAFAGTPHEAWAIRQAYTLVPTWDFSHAVLQECPPCLAVSKLPPLSWSDMGTPARVLEVLGNLPTPPAWMNPLQPAVTGLAS
jgi:mannose-1-phosphate guanylyltransferase